MESNGKIRRVVVSNREGRRVKENDEERQKGEERKTVTENDGE